MRDVLMVIDVQTDYCLPSGALGQMGRDMTPIVAMIERLKTFVAHAREAGVPVVFIRTETKTLCRPGTPGAELCLQPAPGDLVLTKYAYGALDSLLIRGTIHSLAPERLLIAGVDTHICVESTVRQAHDIGYDVTVIADLVATRGENAAFHANSLQVMKKYFADVKTSTEVEREWQTPVAANQ